MPTYELNICLFSDVKQELVAIFINPCGFNSSGLIGCIMHNEYLFFDMF